METDPKNKICVIIDDILDQGETVINLANNLKTNHASKVVLIVTHGVISKGYDTMKILDRIYTTNSFKTLEVENFIKQMKLRFDPSIFEL